MNYTIMNNVTREALWGEIVFIPAGGSTDYANIDMLSIGTGAMEQLHAVTNLTQYPNQTTLGLNIINCNI